MGPPATVGVAADERCSAVRRLRRRKNVITSSTTINVAATPMQTSHCPSVRMAAAVTAWSPECQNPLASCRERNDLLLRATAKEVFLVRCLLVHDIGGAGVLPFEADTPLAVAMKHLNDPPLPPSAVREDLPPSAEAAIMRALAKRRGTAAQALSRCAKHSLSGFAGQHGDIPAQASSQPFNEQVTQEATPSATVQAIVTPTVLAAQSASSRASTPLPDRSTATSSALWLSRLGAFALQTWPYTDLLSPLCVKLGM